MSQVQAVSSILLETPVTVNFGAALGGRHVYFEKNRVFKAGQRLDKLAWNNDKELRFYFVGVLN